MSPLRPDLVDCWIFRVVRSARDVPTTEILPSVMMTVPCCIMPFVTVWIDAFVSAKVPYVPFGL